MCKVKVFLQDDGILDIKCYDENVTVQDLADAMQWAADAPSLNKELRTWPCRSQGSCFGCTYCCERFNIFITNIDAQNLAAGLNVSLNEFLAYFTRYEPWKVNRVRLADPLHFCLDECSCKLYDVRPLVCRLYICAPLSSMLKRVVAEVNCVGEAALVDLKNGDIDLLNPFAHKFSYSQVFLKDVLPQDVWNAIFAGGPPHNLRPVA